MGWGEMQLIPNEYNDEFRSIDETILRLLNERKLLANGKRYFPTKEIMEEWATSYELDIPTISWLMHSLNERSQPKMPNEPGELLSVLPIMKKTVVDGFEYSLTHAMQHKNASIVFLEIEQVQGEEMNGHVRPQLLLEVKGIRNTMFVETAPTAAGDKLRYALWSRRRYLIISTNAA